MKLISAAALRTAILLAASVIGVLCAQAQPLPASSTEAYTVDLLVEWGWGPKSTRTGRLDVVDGEIMASKRYHMEPSDLGVTAVSRRNLQFETQAAGLSDGLLITVKGGLATRLNVALEDLELAFSLADILTKQQIEARYRGGRVRVRRDLRDRLRFAPRHDHLVLAPGQPLTLDLLAKPMTSAGFQPTARISLEGIGFSYAKTLSEGRRASGATLLWTVTVDAPNGEGVYEVLARGSGPGLQGATARLQFVVLDPARKAGSPGRLKKKLITAIDSTAPPFISYLGDGQSRVRAGKLGHFRATSTQGTRAGYKPRFKDHMGWFAHRLPVGNLGRPHLVEIDFPDDAGRTVGISIIEPDARGRIGANNLDTGLDSDGEPSPSGTTETFSLIFWPKSDSPILLITNRMEGSRAAVGDIRVFELTEGLPALDVAPDNGRLLGIYYEEPNIVSNFGGPYRLYNKRSIKDWNTFLLSARNLAEYMRYAGYNATLLQSVGYLSSLYPSDFVDDTGRYDGGWLSPDGMDPIQKDILRLLLGVFARDGLFLVPSLNFEHTIASLEFIRMPDPRGIADIDMVSKDGKTAEGLRAAGRHSIGHWYEPTHPEVRATIIAAVREIVERYKDSPALAGLAIQHRGLSYVQYPGLDWGYGDVPIDLFETDTGVSVPVSREDPTRYRERYAWLMANERDMWIEWRIRKLASLMREISEVVHSVRPDLRVFVNYMNTLYSIGVSDNAVEWSAAGRDLAELFRRKGLDPRQYTRSTGMVVTRPVRTGPRSYYGSRSEKTRAARLHFRDAPAINALYPNGSRTGILAFHEYGETTLAAFDEQVERWHKSNLWLVNTITPFGRGNLARFAHWMADLDPAAIFDGGWQAVMGAELTLMEFSRVYRALPVADFTISARLENGVVARSAQVNGEHYVYLVNESAHPARATVITSQTALIDELGREGTTEASKLTVELAPYALRAFNTKQAAVVDIAQ